MNQGNLCLLLHAHLPFVVHPELEVSIEEHWLYEALTETYLPLLDCFDRLSTEEIPFSLALSISPTLMAMLKMPIVVPRYLRYLDSRLDFADKERIRSQDNPELRQIIDLTAKRLQVARSLYKDRYHGELLPVFKSYQDKGSLELLACPATHGYLPLLELHPEAIYAQLKTGIDSYRTSFGRSPKGMWLPECGFTPSLSPQLKDLGIEYIILESHGLINASSYPVYGTFRPVLLHEGIAAFARDTESGRQVWSAGEGYPGNPVYREFHRDIIYERNMDEASEFIFEDGLRVPTGFKYYAITSKDGPKNLYNPEAAHKKALHHAEDFIYQREQQIKYLSCKMDVPPVLICPYDAELFGHWWYEGPIWLEAVLRGSHLRASVYQLTTPSAFLARKPSMQGAVPSASSWGQGGYNGVWLNESNDWIYPHLHRGAEDLCRLSGNHHTYEPGQIRALNQAARELLLSQSSDWPFIMKNGAMKEYATMRFKSHISHLNTLLCQVKENRVDTGYLEKIEALSPIFPNIDYRMYQSFGPASISN